MTERADELALLMTLEMGKPLAESKAEITYAAEFFRWFSEEARADRGPLRDRAQRRGPAAHDEAAGRARATSSRPWNFPMAMGTRKIGPAIAAGCTMVIKPAQQTPLSMLALAQILEEAGLPGGRAQRRHGSSPRATSSEPLIADPRLRKLSFTGSTEVGRKLIEQSAEQRPAASRWSSAATRRSWSSTTPTSTPPSRAR